MNVHILRHRHIHTHSHMLILTCTHKMSHPPFFSTMILHLGHFRMFLFCMSVLWVISSLSLSSISLSFFFSSSVILFFFCLAFSSSSSFSGVTHSWPWCENGSGATLNGRIKVYTKILWKTHHNSKSNLKSIFVLSYKKEKHYTIRRFIQHWKKNSKPRWSCDKWCNMPVVWCESAVEIAKVFKC